MNNNFFVMTRYMRDIGVAADLFIINSPTHDNFTPQSDTFYDLSEIDWIKNFPYDYSLTNVLKGKSKLRRLLRDYDKIVVCGVAMSYLSRAGIKANMFIPYGSELTVYPFVPISFPKTIGDFAYQIVHYFNRKFQIKGIQQAKCIVANDNWSALAKAMNRLNVGSINLPRLMVYKENHKEFVGDGLFDWSFLDNHDFIVFSPTRHLWKTNAEPLSDFEKFGGAKRNDKLISAFSKVVGKGLYKNPLLVLFEYGADVDESKRLVEQKGISDSVIWLPTMDRKEILVGMSKSTFVGDQFREGMSATSAGTTNEALACGVPVITNSDGAIDDPKDPYFGAPIIQALTEKEIEFILSDYSINPAKYKQIGSQSENWFNDNLGIGLAKKYFELLASNITN